VRRASSSGFTLIELLVVLAIVAVLATVAMVGHRQARIRTAETSAVSALTAVNQAQFLFMQTCGKNRYAPSLAALGTPIPGYEHGFISADLAASDPLEKSGYRVAMTGTPSTEGEQTCTGEVPLDRYRVAADPLVPGVTGITFYGTNTDRVIYADAASFLEDMPESGAPGHGREIK
jgi:prepilin-type N-terminal cleavage/methylation domain-containing protein